MNTTTHLLYLGTAVCFVLGLHLMNSPATARRGNQLSAFGMAVAIALTVVVLIDDGTMTLSEAEPIERLCARLPGLAGPAEPPARLHGDLWNGNVLWGADGHAWLIDPAAHGGHRETDLAMLHLFGCPHLDEVLRGYEQVTPLADGWSDRIGLHQLFPLLVHAVLFGRGYAEQALSTAKAALER